MAKKVSTKVSTLTKVPSAPSLKMNDTKDDEGFADDGSGSTVANVQDVQSAAILKLLNKRTHEFDNINVVVRVKPTLSTTARITEESTNNKNQRRGQQEVQQSSPDDLFPAAGQIQITDPTSGGFKSFMFDVIFEPEASQEQVFEHSRLKKFIDMALEGFASTVFAYGQTGSGKTFTMTGNIFTESSSGSCKSSENESSDSNVSTNVPNGSISPSINLPIEMNGTSNSSSRRGSLKRGSRSGSGKDNNQVTEEVVGLTQFTFAYLWEQIRARKNEVSYVVTTSFLEVYNEHVFDLLNPAPKSLQVRWSKDRGFYAENLFKVECEDLNDLEGVLKEGLKNRSVRSHEMNATSSRSHSLLTINLSSETKDPEDPNGYIKREGKICLVDLAGSEKTKRTGSKGETFIEANNINKSLLVLGNCISSLSSGRTSHIPYRDSILTKLLADSLSGSGMTLMISCVSAHPQDANETIQTLRYASRAKKVKTNPIVRMDPRELAILSLKRDVRALRTENHFLKQQLNLGLGTEMVQPESDSSPLGVNGELVQFPNRPSLTTVDPNLFGQYFAENGHLRIENRNLREHQDLLLRQAEVAERKIDKLEKQLEKNQQDKTEESSEKNSESIKKSSSKMLYPKNSNKSKSITNLVNVGNSSTHAPNETKPIIKGIPAKKTPLEDARRPSIVIMYEKEADGKGGGAKGVGGGGATNNQKSALEVKGSNAISSRRSQSKPRK